jgi:hypothetical protein
VRRAEQQTNCTIFNQQTQILGYADYIDIIGRSHAAFQEAFLALVKGTSRFKDQRNKTKYMIAARNDRTFSDNTFEVVKEFVHL